MTASTQQALTLEHDTPPPPARTTGRVSWWCRKAKAEHVPGFHGSCLMPMACTCSCHAADLIGVDE